MVWVGRDLKDQLVPTHLHGQGHLLPDQVAQSLSNLALNTVKEGASTTSMYIDLVLYLPIRI